MNSISAAYQKRLAHDAAENFAKIKGFHLSGGFIIREVDGLTLVSPAENILAECLYRINEHTEVWAEPMLNPFDDEIMPVVWVYYRQTEFSDVWEIDAISTDVNAL